MAAFLRERVKPGALCLDVGANVGDTVAAFLAAPDGKSSYLAISPIRIFVATWSATGLMQTM